MLGVRHGEVPAGPQLEAGGDAFVQREQKPVERGALNLQVQELAWNDVARKTGDGAAVVFLDAWEGVRDARNLAVVALAIHIGGDKLQPAQQAALLFAGVRELGVHRFVEGVEAVVYNGFDLDEKNANALVVVQTRHVLWRLASVVVNDGHVCVYPFIRGKFYMRNKTQETRNVFFLVCKVNERS